MQLSDDTFKQLSHSIATMRFPLVLAILLLHAETATQFPPGTDHSGFFFPLYPLAIWIGDTGVPAYFFISGLLMFYSSKSYFEQIKSRFRTLFIPYVFWNGLLFLPHLVLWLCGFNIRIDNHSMSGYTPVDYLRVFWDRGSWHHGNSMPILCPMWYIRNLMVMYLLSPLVYYAIRATHFLLPLVFLVFWVNDPTLAFTWQCLAMFSLGAFFAIIDINPLDFLRVYKLDIVLLFVVFGLADNVGHIGFPTFAWNLQLHRLSLVFNTFFVMWLGVYLYDRGVRFTYLSNAAFFVFCTHYPINMVVRKVMTHWPEWPDAVHVVLYFVSVAVVAVACLMFYNLMSRYTPRLLQLATGNRG